MLQTLLVFCTTLAEQILAGKGQTVPLEIDDCSVRTQNWYKGERALVHSESGTLFGFASMDTAKLI